MSEFATSYFGYATYEEYIGKLQEGLNRGRSVPRSDGLQTKEEHDASILAKIDKHVKIVTDEFSFCRGSDRPCGRRWRWEHPVIFPRLPVEVQEWIRTKTTPMQPIYG